MREDNEELRKNIILYGSFGLFALSYVMLRKGYFRYSTRNAVIFYVTASYALCP
jgi:hypothetical protein